MGLGAQIEGDAADVLEALPTDTVGIGPYLCIVDEYAAIVTPGFGVVLTQGRGLGIAAIVASQDYAGILEADQKGAQQMVANTSIKIFMKLQDAEKTWALIRDQAGQSTVLRTSGFSVNEKYGSDYRDSLNTTVEKEDRVELRDLQEQIEGEAHFIFSGQVVRGDMFFANPSLKKAQLRVPQLLQLGQEVSHDQAAYGRLQEQFVRYIKGSANALGHFERNVPLPTFHVGYHILADGKPLGQFRLRDVFLAAQTAQGHSRGAVWKNFCCGNHLFIFAVESADLVSGQSQKPLDGIGHNVCLACGNRQRDSCLPIFA